MPKAKIINENDGATSVEFTLDMDIQERIIGIEMRFYDSPDRDDEGEYSIEVATPRYEKVSGTLDEIIWLRNTLNEAIREVVGL